MSAESKSERLQLLNDALARSRDALGSAVRSDLDRIDLHLRSVSLERIKQLTAILADGSRLVDDVDRLSVLVLLADYTAAVAQMRTAAQIASDRIDAVPKSLKSVRGFVGRQAKVRSKSQSAEKKPHTS